MRKLKATVLAAAMLLSSFGTSATYAQVKTDKLLKDAEYNLGVCGGHSFTEGHVVISTDVKGKQTFVITHFLTGPATLEKDTDPVIFEIDKVGPETPDKILQFHGISLIDKHLIEISAYQLKDKMFVLIGVDGELSHVLYGFVGKLDDAVKYGEADWTYCQELHQHQMKEIPAILLFWLTGSNPVSSGVSGPRT